VVGDGVGSDVVVSEGMVVGGVGELVGVDEDTGVVVVNEPSVLVDTTVCVVF
jgi:hypothetical protein